MPSMKTRIPREVVATELDERFSSPDAKAIPWPDALSTLENAEVYWLTTVRSGGQPHVTPLIGVVLDGIFHFCTGETERKAKNLADNPNCTLVTGCNQIEEGLDIVLEGEAVQITDPQRLQQLADGWKTKYGWEFAVQGDAFFSEDGGRALVFAIDPTKAFGFGKGDRFSQTRWTF